jgi:hypothetical protein
MTRTLIHDAGATKFYRLVSDSICVEQSVNLPANWLEDPVIQAAIDHFCATGLVLGANGRAIGTPFAIVGAPNLFTLSFVPLAGWRESDCVTAHWDVSFFRYEEGDTYRIMVNRAGFS